MRLKSHKDKVTGEYISCVFAKAKQMNTLIEDVLEFLNKNRRDRFK